MRSFEVPQYFKSTIISNLKNFRKNLDPRKKDFSPSILDFGPVRFLMARHFGFCYGVENAIEIAYQTLDKYPNKRIFFLSEMIHNPVVNNDLLAKGIRFIMNTKGENLIKWSEIKSEDIVLIPAFGTTIDIQNKLKEMGVTTEEFDTTCPFVVKVWNRANKLGGKEHSIVIHGKASHEETRATFSHSSSKAPSLIIQDMAEAEILADFILQKRPAKEFYKVFANRYSEGFEVETDLSKIGVVNQTTMLASETQSIANYLKDQLEIKYGLDAIKEHFADTRDTLCYATNDNQQATYKLLEEAADFAIVVGGYNSSNTTHLVELCEEKLPTYFISQADKILSKQSITHFDIHSKEEVGSNNFIPKKESVNIILTSGASCPDALVEQVMMKLLTYFNDCKSLEEVMSDYEISE